MNIFSYLNIPETSTPDEVKAAYRSAAQKIHPDITGDSEEMSKLNQLYQEYVEGRDRPPLFMIWITEMIEDDSINCTDDLIKNIRGQKYKSESLIRISIRRIEQRTKKLNTLKTNNKHLDAFIFSKLERSINELQHQVDSAKKDMDTCTQALKYLENLEWEAEEKDQDSYRNNKEIEFIKAFFKQTR